MFAHFADEDCRHYQEVASGTSEKTKRSLFAIADWQIGRVLGRVQLSRSHYFGSGLEGARKNLNIPPAHLTQLGCASDYCTCEDENENHDSSDLVAAWFTQSVDRLKGPAPFVCTRPRCRSLQLDGLDCSGKRTVVMYDRMVD
jgi:hypothetical protein